jgi:hypothetical protein
MRENSPSDDAAVVFEKGILENGVPDQSWLAECKRIDELINNLPELESAGNGEWANNATACLRNLAERIGRIFANEFPDIGFTKMSENLSPDDTAFKKRILKIGVPPKLSQILRERIAELELSQKREEWAESKIDQFRKLAERIERVFTGEYPFE